MRDAAGGECCCVSDADNGNPFWEEIQQIFYPRKI